MAQELFEVALFPLSVVLFPGMALPIHIFEPRYRRMMADCLDDRAPFGIVLALPESTQMHEVPAKVGTLARIADYEQLPDGRYNMLAVGTSRFEIADLRNERPYLTGLVRPLADMDAHTTSMDELAAEARAALRTYLGLVLTLLGSEQRHLEIPEDAADLSFLIGMCLTCEDCEKQKLLELRSLAERLRAGTETLRLETDKLAKQVELGVRPGHGNFRASLN